MDHLYVLILTFLFSNCLFAQMKYTVSTDKGTYHYGESINVTITAANSGDTAVTLKFISCEQADYLIDSFDWAEKLIWCQAITERGILPHDSTVWGGEYFEPYPSDSLAIGRHAVIGEVGQYWVSDTLWITVLGPTDVWDVHSIPKGYALGNNYPNPFNPTTTIQFALPHSAMASLKVFNIFGEEVTTLVQRELDIGTHYVKFDASSLPSGIYFYRLQAGTFRDTKKLLLLR